MRINPLPIKASLEIEGDTHARSLSEDAKINESDLEGEFLRQAELFAWWATMTELAKDRVARTKTELLRKSAEIDHQFRSDWNIRESDRKQKADKAEEKYINHKYTEKMAENYVLHHDIYQSIENDLLEAKKQLGFLQAGRDALMVKKDMLISVGANYRAEGMANPVIMKDAARERARQSMERRQKEEEEESAEAELTELAIKRKPVKKKN